MDSPTHRETVRLELTGSEAEHGIPWDRFATFIENFRGALRDHLRDRRAQQTKRGGRPASVDELATAFRIVKLTPGSAIVELEPIGRAEPDEDQAAIADAEALATENLRSLLDSIDQADAKVDVSVTEALERARRALGNDGRIGVVLAGGTSRPHPRRVDIDAERIAELERRARRHQPLRLTRISGRLHMIDVEPGRVGIRAADNVDWQCSYPEELEKTVKSLIDTNVSARGVGQRLGASRGTLAIESIQPVGEYEQTELFTFERVPLDELMRQQGIRGPQGSASILPDDLTDDEVDAFVEALNDV